MEVFFRYHSLQKERHHKVLTPLVNDHRLVEIPIVDKATERDVSSLFLSSRICCLV